MENLHYFKTVVVTVNIPPFQPINTDTIRNNYYNDDNRWHRVNKKSNLNKEHKPQLMHKGFSLPLYSFTKQE